MQKFTIRLMEVLTTNNDVHYLTFIDFGRTTFETILSSQHDIRKCVKDGIVEVYNINDEIQIRIEPSFINSDYFIISFYHYENHDKIYITEQTFNRLTGRGGDIMDHDNYYDDS